MVIDGFVRAALSWNALSARGFFLESFVFIRRAPTAFIAVLPVLSVNPVCHFLRKHRFKENEFGANVEVFTQNWVCLRLRVTLTVPLNVNRPDASVNRIKTLSRGLLGSVNPAGNVTQIKAPSPAPSIRHLNVGKFLSKSRQKPNCN